MLFWQNHKGAGPPGLSVWGWQEAGVTAVTARADPGVGAKVWRKTSSSKREEYEEEVLPLPSSGLLLWAQDIVQLHHGSEPGEAKHLIHVVERKEPGDQTGSQPPPRASFGFSVTRE